MKMEVKCEFVKNCQGWVHYTGTDFLEGFLMEILTSDKVSPAELTSEAPFRCTTSPRIICLH